MCGSFRFARYARFLRQLGSIGCAGLLLAACSSDGGGGAALVATPITGTFVDSPVNGLHYTSLPSNPAGGVTANGGQYQCVLGDTVTFDLGGRVIGPPQPCGELVTVVSVFGATSITDLRVQNLAQLLLTLGGIPAGQNPIELPATLPATLPAQLNFSDPQFEQRLQTALPGQTLVSQDQAAAHLRASFTTLTVTGVTSGTVASTPAGILCAAGDCSYDFVRGTPVTLAAVGTGFTGWNGDGCTGAGTCQILLTATQAVRAVFLASPPPATLTINPNPGTGTGQVQCSTGGAFGPCAVSYSTGTQLTLRGVANSGSTFAGWSTGTGNISCTGIADCSVTVTADSSVTATFTLTITTFSVTATIATTNSGGGTVQCSVNGSEPAACGSYPVGSTIDMTATPDAVSNFTGWTGAGCTGAGTCSFTLTANTAVTAHFNRPVLTVTVVGTGTVSSSPTGITNCAISCTASFNRGTSITLMATGAGFSGWSGGCSGTGTCVVALTADVIVTATFSSSGVACPVEPALVKDINVVSRNSNPRSLTNVNGVLFLTANDGVHGEELWKSDGTASGTILVKDINIGSGGSTKAVNELVGVNGTLFFTAIDLVHGDELWKSDGTEAGTVVVKEIGAGSFGSAVAGLTNVNGTLFFTANDGIHGTKLWRTNGTEAGTFMVTDSNLSFPIVGGTSLSFLTNVNGVLFFFAFDSGSGMELWKSDGTAGGTMLVKDIYAGPIGSRSFATTGGYAPAYVNGFIYFLADDGVHGPELWKSDGTDAGTVLVKDITPGPSGSFIEELTSAGGRIFFRIHDGTGYQLGVSDGTVGGTGFITTGSPGVQPVFLTDVNGTLYFSGNHDAGTFFGVWKSDGTPSGTMLIKDVRAPQFLTNVNGTVFFSGGQPELWRSDGTTANTVQVKDIFPGPIGSAPGNLTNANGRLFFAATDSISNGRELWIACGAP